MKYMNLLTRLKRLFLQSLFADYGGCNIPHGCGVLVLLTFLHNSRCSVYLRYLMSSQMI